jgi:hypothetical protein
MFFSDQIVFDDKILFDMNFEESLPTNKYGYETSRPPYLIDKNHTYKINKNKFRGNDIRGDEKLLIAGDSITFGIGVPEEKIWASTVASNLNLTHANLGIPGASTMLIVKSVFSYFKKYQNPKHVFCLFPDPDRMMVPHVEGRLESIENPKKEKFSNLFLDGYTDDFVPKYSKMPHLAEHVIPKNVARWISLQYIHMLEQYCKSSGINFFWSTWHSEFGNSILEANDKLNIFNNYIHLCDEDYTKLQFDKNNNCHKDLKNKYPEIFYIGGDIEFGIEHAHPGLHQHIHISDFFEKRFKDDYIGD